MTGSNRIEEAKAAATAAQAMAVKARAEARAAAAMAVKARADNQ